MFALVFFVPGQSLQGEHGKPLYSKFDEDGVPTHDAAGAEFGKVREY